MITFFLAAILFGGGYVLCTAVYRLYLSPLAKFPGPKLAALSKWYEAYYEIVLKGQFTAHINDLHEKYGPIVRITPFELHIKDPSFWDTLYVRYPKSNKYAWTSGRFGNDTSVFTTAEHGVHKIRRGALSPMFSRRAVLSFEPVVQSLTDALCDGIKKYSGTGGVLTISDGYSAFAGDVITEYALGFQYHDLESEGFKQNLHKAFLAVSEFGHITLQFPWVTPLMNSLPDNMVEKMNPPLQKLLQLQRDLRKKIAQITKENEKGVAQPEHPTVFHTVLQSDIPLAEKSNLRLAEEAQLVMGAGVETTSWALANATYYILSDERVEQALRTELREAIPDPSRPGAFDYQRLENLPYLKGCIKEGVRFSHGVTARNARLIPEYVSYKEWAIPPMTPVSMTIADVHFDESIYKDARKFVPERWMADVPKALDGSSLDRYFVAFGKGPRSCLGINLAYMELTLVLAHIFRRLHLELYETDESDVLMVHDFFLPCPKLDSKGIRVRVLAEDG